MNLFIDTHLNNVVIILESNGEIIRKKIIENERNNSKTIMPSIKKVLAKSIPDSIIVVNGPGSFTGVRLGVTIAKTLSYSWQKPIFTVTSLEEMAISIDKEDKTVAFSDGNGYYIGIFNKNNVLIGEYEYLNKSQYELFVKKYEVTTDVVIDYIKVIEFALHKEPVNTHLVNPIYIKKLDIEK